MAVDNLTASVLNKYNVMPVGMSRPVSNQPVLDELGYQNQLHDALTYQKDKSKKSSAELFDRVGKNLQAGRKGDQTDRALDQKDKELQIKAAEKVAAALAKEKEAAIKAAERRKKEEKDNADMYKTLRDAGYAADQAYEAVMGGKFKSENLYKEREESKKKVDLSSITGKNQGLPGIEAGLSGGQSTPAGAQKVEPKQTKKTAEQRFNELSSQGVNEDEIYRILQSEGYK